MFPSYKIIKYYKKLLPIITFCAILLFVLRECWNWQTGKTKDLVGVCSCGFKSHLPHYNFERESLIYKGSQFILCDAAVSTGRFTLVTSFHINRLAVSN